MEEKAPRRSSTCLTHPSQSAIASPSTLCRRVCVAVRVLRHCARTASPHHARSNARHISAQCMSSRARTAWFCISASCATPFHCCRAASAVLCSDTALAARPIASPTMRS
eukprot:3693755-Rhodomonas_salina.2